MWEPQYGAQTSAFLAWFIDELFYGGERGGGKSDFQLGYQENGALRFGGKSRGIMFRKTYAELEELQARACEIFPSEGAVYKTQPSAEYPFSNCWYWPNGATVKMRFIEHERDYGRYHGHSYSHLSFDEVTEYETPGGLLKMMSTLRNAHGVPCTARLTGNPGGVGHIWVKGRYISVAPPMTPFRDPDSGFERLFVPSKTSDNQILLRNDPDYKNRIRAATGGNEALRKAWLEGDWDVIAGAFFDCWNREKHVIRPFTIPEPWTRFRSFDWGSARPFSVGWWAVSDGNPIPDGRLYPRGAMIRYREWYGCKPNEPNVGLKLDAEVVAQGIVDRSGSETYAYSVADPACTKRDGGPSIKERMFNEGNSPSVLFVNADNSRVAGWDQVRARLTGDDEPMIYTFDSCLDSIRTVPLMQHDKDKIEDINTEMEDHAADEWRYACMSRPFVRANPLGEKTRYATDQTIDELIAAQRRKRQE